MNVFSKILTATSLGLTLTAGASDIPPQALPYVIAGVEAESAILDSPLADMDHVRIQTLAEDLKVLAPLSPAIEKNCIKATDVCRALDLLQSCDTIINNPFSQENIDRVQSDAATLSLIAHQQAEIDKAVNTISLYLNRLVLLDNLLTVANRKIADVATDDGSNDNLALDDVKQFFAKRSADIQSLDVIPYLDRLFAEYNALIAANPRSYGATVTDEVTATLELAFADDDEQEVAPTDTEEPADDDNETLEPSEDDNETLIAQ